MSWLKTAFDYIKLLRCVRSIKQRGGQMNLFLVMDLMESHGDRYRVADSAPSQFFSRYFGLKFLLEDTLALVSASDGLKTRFDNKGVLYWRVNNIHLLVLKCSSHLEALKVMVSSLPAHKELSVAQVDLIVKMSDYRWNHGTL